MCGVDHTESVRERAVGGFVPYFHEQAGLPTAKAFDLGVGLYGAAIVANVLCCYWMAVAGRRTLYLIGQALSLLVLLVTGVVGSFKASEAGTGWALGSLIMLLAVVFDSTLGPVSVLLIVYLFLNVRPTCLEPI